MSRGLSLPAATILAFLALVLFAPVAQAYDAAPQLTITLSSSSVAASHTFVATVEASTSCETLTARWNGQERSTTGHELSATFTAPAVTTTTVVELQASCESNAGPTVSLDRDVTVLPAGTGTETNVRTPPSTGGGVNIAWLILIGGVVVLLALAGGGVLLVKRQRRTAPSLPSQVSGSTEDLLIRAALPTVTSTVLITVFFGLFGLIPAAINASHAKRVGASGRPYWKAFWITVGIQWAVALVLVLLAVIALKSGTSSG